MMKQKLKKQNTIPGLVLLLLMFFSSFSASLVAQERITGVVKDVSGAPIPGVNVLQKGTLKGTATDFDGNYSIKLVPGQKKLVFSFIGFKTQEISIGGKTVINATLEENAQSLDEVVIIGYAAVSREKVLGSLGTVKAESIEQATPVSALEGIQGKVSGVQILTNGGPGEGLDIRIRGTSTFEGGVNPLYVVDGQQLEDIDNLNPDDIESMEVIKDGATGAIYGTNGANGVILITTKKGKPGDLKVNISSISGISQLVGDIRVANTRQRLRYERLKAGAVITGFESDTLGILRNYSWDLQKLITRPAIRQQINVAITGGNDKAKFYWNNGFLNEDGIVMNSNFRRLTSNIKLDLNLSKNLTMGTRVNLTFDEKNGLDEAQVFVQLVERIPYFPVFEPDGSYAQEFGGRQNPLAETLATRTNRNYRAQIFSYAQLQILPKLTFKATLGINYNFSKYNNFNPIITLNPATPIATGQERFTNNSDLQQESFINYKNKWGKHTFGAFAGMQTQVWNSERFDIRANFNNEYVETFGNTDPLNIVILNGTDNYRNSLYSLFGGFNYDFKGKYLISGTFRRDGSSRFGANTKYGVFPSLSLGWKVNKESFLNKIKTINNLTIRASYGIVGNQRVGNYEFTGAFEPGFNYNGLGGIAPSRLGNDILKWEKTASTNLGLDLAMFKNRLTLNVDVWKKVTTDLLARVQLPEETGFNGIRKNVGSVDNRGIDFTIGGTILKSKKFTWKSSFNIAYQENEVTKLDGGTPFDSGNYRIEEGQPIGNIFGYKNLGVYQYKESNAYTPEGIRLTPNFANGTFVNYTLNGAEYTGTVRKMQVGSTVLAGGDIIWEDLNGDFSITANDRQIIGNGLAKYFGGFSNDFKFNNFSFAFLFDYSFGQDLYRAWDEARNDLNSNNETPGPDRIDGAWVNEGDITEFPRLKRVAQNRNRPNSYFVTRGDYIKLRYVKLEYNLNKDLFKTIKGISGISLNLAVNNVLTWTEYIGWNPELGNRGNPLNPGLDNLRYPNDRELIIGLKVQLN
ncbi:MAG TPA: hypothetical protein DCS17_04055 [Flavobacterium sp.]|nr:hypothetical protein [Flavobacterium sp.]